MKFSSQTPTLILAVLLPSLLLGTGCQSVSAPDEPIEQVDGRDRLLEAPPEFSFDTTSDAGVDIAFVTSGGTPVQGVQVAFSRIQDGRWSETRRRMSDPDGRVSLAVPTDQAESVFGVAILEPGFKDSTLVTVEGGQTVLTFEQVLTGGSQRPAGKNEGHFVSGASIDTDRDGVPDDSDVDPYDRHKAFIEYDPGRFTYGSIIFEDLWPQRGDYDFNDLVLDYNTTYIVDTKGSVASMSINLIVRAIGAGYRNGLGFELDIPPGHVQSVTGQSLSRGYTKRNGNGTEAGQPRAVIIAFEDAYDVVPGARGNFANTRPEQPAVGYESIIIQVEFNNPVPRYKIGNAPYNIFLIASGDRGREIHLPGNEPTALSSRSMFGSGDDASNGGTTYTGGSGLPWAMHVPRSFDYPRENVPITQAHLKFRAWAESGGRDYPDWYTNKQGYRKVEAIY